MKRSYFFLITAILMNLLPAYAFAEGDNGGVDMAAYSTVAGYGFLIIIILFFSLFLYFYSDKFAELPEIKTPPVVSATGKLTGKLSGEILPTVNIIYYSVISLIVLYILIFVFLIL